VALGSGTASLSTTALTAGSHSLASVYSGDKTHQPSTSPASTVSVLVASTTSLSATPTLATVGQAVTLTASVAGNAPTGTVQFKDGGNNLGAPVAVGNGVATLSTNQLAVGSHSISSAYSGDTGNAASTSSSIPVGVNASSTSTTLSVSPSQVTAGQVVTLTATVAGFQPSGSVTFLDGNVSLGSATLSNGTASLAIGSLAAGSHSLSASYAGDANNLASNSPTVSTTIASAPADSDGDVPTLPEWAALLLSLLLGAQAWWQRQGKGEGC